VDPHILRPTVRADVDLIVGWELEPDNSRFIAPWEKQRHLGALSDPDIEHLVAEAVDAPVGFVILAGLTGPNCSIEFRRIVINKKGRGYGRATVEAVIDRAFEAHGAHRLWLDVKDDNFRARALYESTGFLVEGRLRDCLKAGGRYESLIVMSMLSDEYLARLEGDEK
jgi:diamine N-acetyltransferase